MTVSVFTSTISHSLRLKNKKVISRTSFILNHCSSLLLLLSSLFFTEALWAQTDTARSYKISVIIFKHLSTDKNFQVNTLTLWSESAFSNSIDLDNNLLPQRESALAGAYRALSRDPNEQILYHGAWLSPFQTGESRLFHFHKNFETSGNKLDGLIKITMRYYFDVNFKMQLLTPSIFNSLNFYKISALDEIYQTPSNQLQYIDSPNYGALILITKAN